jgi:hypothetical protein
MMIEVVKYGPESMSENMVNGHKKAIKKKIRNILEYFVNYKNFLEIFTELASLMIACIRNKDMKDCMNMIGKKVPSLFKGQK